MTGSWLGASSTSPRNSTSQDTHSVRVGMLINQALETMSGTFRR